MTLKALLFLLAFFQALRCPAGVCSVEAVGDNKAKQFLEMMTGLYKGTATSLLNSHRFNGRLQIQKQVQNPNIYRFLIYDYDRLQEYSPRLAVAPDKSKIPPYSLQIFSEEAAIVIDLRDIYQFSETERGWDLITRIREDKNVSLMRRVVFIATKQKELKAVQIYSGFQPRPEVHPTYTLLATLALPSVSTEKFKWLFNELDNSTPEWFK